MTWVNAIAEPLAPFLYSITLSLQILLVSNIWNPAIDVMKDVRVAAIIDCGAIERRILVREVARSD